MLSKKVFKKIKGGNIKVYHQEDRLSKLPDEILINILSRLKTSETIRSGILSKRWNSIWGFVPVLDLNQSDFKFNGYFIRDVDRKIEETDRFWNFMDQMLIARRLPCLEKIRIRGTKCDPYRVRSWMSAALERDANELDVEFSELSEIDSPCQLTNGLFSYNKLVILKLRVDMTLNFHANSYEFPNLGVLLLDSIIYENEDTLPNLLASCPILEDLVIIRGREDKIGTLNLISRSVKRLKVRNESYNCAGKMVFDAPAVESLDIDCIRTEEILVNDLSRLVDAKFEVLELDTYKLLKDVSHVKYLRLEGWIAETILNSNDRDFLMFYNLTRLEIYNYNCCKNSACVDGGKSKNLIWELLIEILKCSPNLQYLIYQASEFSSQEYSKASNWDVPNCLVKSLRTVELNCCSDSDADMARYFLENAQVLEKITIRKCSNLSEDLKSRCYAIIKDKIATMTYSENVITVSFLY